MVLAKRRGGARREVRQLLRKLFSFFLQTDVVIARIVKGTHLLFSRKESTVSKKREKKNKKEEKESSSRLSFFLIHTCETSQFF